MEPQTSQRGQVVPLTAAFIVFTGFVLMGLAHLAGGAVDRAQAKRAADIAALAGAAEGEAAARKYAADNGATLRAFKALRNEATVELDYGDARAVSKAKREGGGSSRPGAPAPALQAALARAAQILGHKPAVVRASGYVATLTPAGFNELLPRAAEAGLCASGPNQLKVCGSS